MPDQRVPPEWFPYLAIEADLRLALDTLRMIAEHARVHGPPQPDALRRLRLE